jgi:DNA sulfur modification protein DndD
MIFHKLRMKNFGVYAGEHEIELCPEKKGSPVILFGGLNGRGKTTLLDAIQLLFFGKLNKCSNRGRNAYDKFLFESMTRGINPADGSSLELEFEEGYESSSEGYWIKRSWTKTNGKIQEKFEVLKGGERDDFLSQNWLENVDRFLPFGLAELFFFDGEKIESLAEETTAKTILESAIKTLFGVDLISQLDNDLQELEKKLAKEGTKPEENKYIQELEKELGDTFKKANSLKSDEVVANEKLDLLNKQFEEVQEKYRLQGGLMAEKRESLESSKKEHLERKDRILDELRSFASQGGPLLLVESQIATLRSQAISEQNVETQNILLEELSARDKKIIKSLKKAEIDEGARMILETLFDSDIQERKKQTNEQSFLNLEKSDHEKVVNYSTKFFEELKKAISKTLESLVKIEQEIKNIEEFLLATPDEESVLGLREKMFKLEAELIKYNAAKNVAAEEKLKALELTKVVENKIEAKRKEFNDRKFIEDETKRKIKYAQKTRVTLGKYRERIISLKIGKVENLILECFQRLLQKKKLVKSIKISRQDFSILLIDENEGEIELSRMSAGERQLLAVSILWGLARASNRQIPNIIDTPLGRLDGNHRDNIVRNYFTKASDQVIILSTDEEIDENLLSVLGNAVSRQYELIYSDESKSTRVQEGYFFN